MFFKRIILLIATAAVFSHSAAWAQERPPLAMQIEFEWTVIGVVGGAAVGFLLWLTDPANPNNNLADSVSAGAAWGTLLGAGFGVVVLQRSAIFPAGFVQVQDPLAPANRITADPIGDREGGSTRLALGRAGSMGSAGFAMPLLNLRF